jgi:hypothetical protein
MAENGRFGDCFRHPFHQSLTHAPGSFNLFLGFSRQAFQGFELPQQTCSHFRHLFLLPLPHFFRGACFGSSSSLPKMGFSPIYLRVLARSIYGTVFPTGLRPCLPRRPPLIVLPLLSSALRHECTTISNPPCASSSTLDRACVPRRDISETGEISEGWLASAEP